MNPSRIFGLALSTVIAAAGPVAAQPTSTPAQRVAADALRDACKADYDRFCAGVRPGGGRVLQCFETNAAALAPTCRSALARARQSRAAVPGTTPK